MFIKTEHMSDFSSDYQPADDDDFYQDATQAFIQSHTAHDEKCEVTFRLKYSFNHGRSWHYIWVGEEELQHIMPNLVLTYWHNLGGRCQSTNFDKYHVFRIIGEEKRYYKVQWIGYSEEDASWEMKKKIERIRPLAVLAWKAR
ncbi:hypothetical protein LB507_010306 [Fusarium sp. FIESC RH6]|nr:hypothetical protein LB507_010306 [Fusarium sp. FIESC RH6]